MITLRRVYDQEEPGENYKVPVDMFWPRGGIKWKVTKQCNGAQGVFGGWREEDEVTWIPLNVKSSDSVLTYGFFLTTEVTEVHRE